MNGYYLLMYYVDLDLNPFGFKYSGFIAFTMIVKYKWILRENFWQLDNKE